MRLDKFVSKAAYLSRKDASLAIKKGRVTVDGIAVKSPEGKVDEISSKVTLDGKALSYSQYVYIMLNKPSGVLSATEDGKGITVVDLLPDKYRKRDIFPVGRLDKDTVGLMLITDNGPLAHRLLSPKHHADKSYYLKAEKTISDDDAERLEKGVYIGEGITTMPALFSVDPDRMGGKLTIREGKFHQIKRMLEAVDNKVTFLERISFGPLVLDRELQRGEWRELSDAEIEELEKMM